MADSAGTPADALVAAKPPPGAIARSMLRAAGSTAVLVVIYYLLPLDHSVRWLAITMLAIGLAALIGLIIFQVHAIIVDSVVPAGCPRCGRAAKSQESEIRRLRKEAGGACAIIRAPAVFPPPRGVRALADWGRTWETEAE